MNGKLQILVTASLAYVNSRASQERVDTITADYKLKFDALESEKQNALNAAYQIGSSAMNQYSAAISAMRVAHPNLTDDEIDNLVLSQARLMIAIGDVSGQPLPTAPHPPSEAQTSIAPIPVSVGPGVEAPAIEQPVETPTAIVGDADGEETQPRRKRGRPRKNPVQPSDTGAASNEEDPAPPEHPGNNIEPDVDVSEVSSEVSIASAPETVAADAYTEQEPSLGVARNHEDIVDDILSVDADVRLVSNLDTDDEFAAEQTISEHPNELHQPDEIETHGASDPKGERNTPWDLSPVAPTTVETQSSHGELPSVGEDTTAVDPNPFAFITSANDRSQMTYVVDGLAEEASLPVTVGFDDEAFDHSDSFTQLDPTTDDDGFAPNQQEPEFEQPRFLRRN